MTRIGIAIADSTDDADDGPDTPRVVNLGGLDKSSLAERSMLRTVQSNLG